MPYCYPTGVNEAINGQCARYPVAWKNGKPDYAPVTFDNSANVTASPGIAASRVSVSPNPSVGNITAKYNTEAGGKIHISIYDKTGLSIYEKDAYAIKGDNSYYVNLAKAVSGVYYIEITAGVSSYRSKFVKE